MSSHLNVGFWGLDTFKDVLLKALRALFSQVFQSDEHAEALEPRLFRQAVAADLSHSRFCYRMNDTEIRSRHNNCAAGPCQLINRTTDKHIMIQHVNLTLVAT